MPQPVRIGVIGAGAFTTRGTIPNFQGLPDVTVTAVANRSRASAEKVAAQFGIPNVVDDFRNLITRSDVDAVFIGAPPYVHKEASLAALSAGKHVLCQVRMTLISEDAREMCAKADEARSRGLRTMLMPGDSFYRGAKYVSHLIESGYLGKLRHVQGFNMNDSLADIKAPQRRGRDWATYGQFNALQVGLSYQVLAQWTGYATNVMAQQTMYVTERPAGPDGPMIKNPYADEVTIVSDTTSSAILMNLQNHAVRFAESRVELYGDEGTVIYRAAGDVIQGAHLGDKGLHELPIPPEFANPWRVEEEFIRLIRGEINEPQLSFKDGLLNQEYMEAAYRSAVEGRRIELELGQ